MDLEIDKIYKTIIVVCQTLMWPWKKKELRKAIDLSFGGDP